MLSATERQDVSKAELGHQRANVKMFAHDRCTSARTLGSAWIHLAYHRVLAACYKEDINLPCPLFLRYRLQRRLT